MLVIDMYNNRESMFPEIFYESIPLTCPEPACEYPMQISETLTKVNCANPRCPSKIAQRLLALANSIGVKDLGESRAEKFVRKFGITNPMSIFMYEPDEDGFLGDGISYELSVKIAKQFQSRNKFTLSEYVSYSNLPFLQTSALDIFGGYDDLEKAYEDIERGGIEFISNKLSIMKAWDISSRAISVYSSLMTYKNDLFETLDAVSIIRTNTADIKKLIALCSDQVGYPFNTKAEFYAEVNNMNTGIHVEFLKTFKDDIDYLIWAGADGSPARHTNKVKKAEALNKKAGKVVIPIVTASQFIQIIKRLSGE